MFDLKLLGSKAVLKAFDKLILTPEELKKVLYRSAVVVQRAAVANVSNKVLHRRTGNLATSIKIDDSDLGDLRVRVGVGAQAEYGAAHEFGATTRPHIIRPRFAKVLRWNGAVVGVTGRQRKNGFIDISSKYDSVFATEVHHPGSVIPKRPWLMPAYESNKDRIIGDFQTTLLRSLSQVDRTTIE